MMIQRQHDPNRTAGILIIGAGASGGAAAAMLAEVGFDVVCLEQGHWQEASRYPTVERDWEFRRLGSWSYNPNKRKLPEDYPINTEEPEVAWVSVDGVSDCHLPGVVGCLG